MKTLATAALILAVLLVPGTAGADSLTRPTADQVVPPPPGKAQIVFIRATGAFIYSVVLSILYEAGPEKDVLISPIENKTKVVYDLDPGRHLFLSHGPIWTHFMAANVEAGKRYYVLVRPIHGRGFQLRPLRKDATDYNMSRPEFEVWLKESKRVENGDLLAPYLSRFQGNLDEVRAKGLEEWKAKTPAQIAELTLNPEDGVEP